MKRSGICPPLFHRSSMISPSFFHCPMNCRIISFCASVPVLCT